MRRAGWVRRPSDIACRCHVPCQAGGAAAQPHVEALLAQQPSVEGCSSRSSGHSSPRAALQCFLNERKQSALTVHAALSSERVKTPYVICVVYTHIFTFRSAALGRASVSFARTHCHPED